MLLTYSVRWWNLGSHATDEEQVTSLHKAHDVALFHICCGLQARVFVHLDNGEKITYNPWYTNIVDLKEQYKEVFSV